MDWLVTHSLVGVNAWSLPYKITFQWTHKLGLLEDLPEREGTDCHDDHAIVDEEILYAPGRKTRISIEQHDEGHEA